MVALDNTYGALLIGVAVAAILYGCTCIQTWYYFSHYPSDWWFIKLLVAALLISDTCHQALITHAIYTYLVTNFRTSAELTEVVWSLPVAVFFNGFTTFCVQSFLAIRIYRLSKENWLVTGSVVIMIISQFIMVIVYASNVTLIDTFAQLVPLKALLMAIIADAVAGDIFIAVSLCYLLYKSQSGFRKSDTLIDQLIIFSVNTSLLASLCAIASLICISAWPHTFIYIALYFNIGRLYCNALLTTLNAREGLRGEFQDDGISFCQKAPRVPVTTRTRPGSESKRVPPSISIKVDTTHEFIQDEQYSLNHDMKNREMV